MGQYKIFASKTVGILEDYPTINTGENEVAELWYGQYGLSRILMQFDFSNYLAEYTNNLVPVFSATSDIVLCINNCSPIFEDYDLSIDTTRATSADIILHSMASSWDEGGGHDYVGTNVESGFACWSSAQTLSNWITDGGDYSTEIMRCSMDKGNENFSGSVSGTDLLWSTVTGTNNGYILKFTDEFEALSGESKSLTKFYTRHTNTVNEPNIHVYWDNQVTDQYDEISPGSSKQLCFYSKNGGTFKNVYALNAVTVLFSDSAITPTGFTSVDITNPMPGIYSVDFDCPEAVTGGTIITVLWNVQYEENQLSTSVEKTLTAITSSESWTNVSTINPKEYWVTTPDLQKEYIQGSKIFLDVLFRQPYTRIQDIIKTGEYKINILHSGLDEVEYLSWEPLSYTDSTNFMYIDTSWFKSGFDYRIYFKYETDGNIIIDMDNNRKFKVI